MSLAPDISVLMATRGKSPHLAAALRSIDAQSLRPRELLIVWTAPADPPTGALGAIAGSNPDGGVPRRLVRAPGANLAAALNAGLRAARCPLVARMDDDDECMPGRLAAQAAYLGARPEIDVVGTAFERIDDAGRTLDVGVPPCDPGEVRWRLLLGNCVAHGSVMLRRAAALEAGGYDESCQRAQDYELWLRLTRARAGIANLAEVLYRYRCAPEARGAWGWRSSGLQAEVAADAMARAWRGLPEGDPSEDAVGGVLHAARARLLEGDASGVAEIEALMTRHGPTRARLAAWWWAGQTVRGAGSPEGAGAPPWSAIEAGRRALLREAGRRLARAGAARVWLWGAGRHTGWVLRHAGDLGVPVAGIVDDAKAGTLAYGFQVGHPSELDDSCHALLSSDLHEDAMWASSVSARARGVIVWRLYRHESAARAEGVAA